MVKKFLAVLLAVGLMTTFCIPKCQAQEGTCLILTQVAVDAMEVGYQTRSREVCSMLVERIVEGWKDKEIYVWQIPFYLPIYREALDLVAVSCLKGVEWAEKGESFEKEKAFRILFNICVEGK